MKWTYVYVLSSLVLLAACSDDTKDEPAAGVCGAGELVEVLGVQHCIYGETLIIEGFLCPQEAPRRHDLEDAVVCSDSDEALSDEFLSELEDKGYNPDPIEVDPNEPCRDGAQGRLDCNDCVCENGGWSCTEIACGEPEPCERATTEDACGALEVECEWALCAQDAGCPNISGGACVSPPQTDDACGEDPLRISRVCEICNCTDGSWQCDGTPCQQCEAFTDFADCDNAGPGCSWAQCPQDDFDCPNPEGGICVEPPTSGESCEVPGVSGADAADGCNRCSCDDGGFWSCTEIGCE
jgi:hypothetical protein